MAPSFFYARNGERLRYTKDMEARSNPAKEPLTDSPWFWIYLFATAALVLLIVSKPKLDYRQAWLERQHQARQFSHQLAEGREIQGELIQPDSTRFRVEYFVYLLTALLLLGWGRLWYSRFSGAWRSTPEVPGEPASRHPDD